MTNFCCWLPWFITEADMVTIIKYGERSKKRDVEEVKGCGIDGRKVGQGREATLGLKEVTWC